MKLRFFILLSIVPCAMIAKLYLHSWFLLEKTEHPNLNPILAGYVGKSLRQYSFGFNNLLSSLLWIQMLQKADHTPVGENEVSWEYAQVDAITSLDPKFERAYSYGAVFISVLRRDKLGGKFILEKWAKMHPTKWRPHYMLGVHLFEELDDYHSAATHILRASSMENAPLWLSSLGIRLLSEEGSLINAINSAVELVKSASNPVTVERLSLRIRSLNYNYRKSEWTTALEEYRKKTGKVPASIETLRPYLANSQRTIASIVEINQEELPEEILKILAEQFEFRLDPSTKSITSLDPSLERSLGKSGIFLVPKAIRKGKPK